MIDVADFFCGCGGTSAGLQKAGLNIVLGIDNDPDSGTTFAKNFPNSDFLLQDICSLQPYDLYSYFPKIRVRPLFFSACAPCQPFTRQRTLPKPEDDRSSLLDEIHRFIRVFRPEYIFVENVAGLQNFSSDEGPLGRFFKLLQELAYEVGSGVLRAQDYGVPQYRRRFVLLASSLGHIAWPPAATHGPDTANLEFETVWSWIGNLPPLRAGDSHPTFANHRAARLSELNLERITHTPLGGGRHNWPKHLTLDCHSDHDGHTDVYGRLHKDRPAAALTTRCISLSNGRFGHPTQNRALSVREAARLQTFDDSFSFEGSLNSMARQIGNAVPVRFAEIFGRYILEHYEHSMANVGAR